MNSPEIDGLELDAYILSVFLNPNSDKRAWFSH